jgi:hypothetical protein
LRKRTQEIEAEVRIEAEDMKTRNYYIFNRLRLLVFEMSMTSLI